MESFTWFQQGDVKITPVNEIPEYNPEDVVTDGVVAEGEATGHKHVIIGPGAVIIRDRKSGV